MMHKKIAVDVYYSEELFEPPYETDKQLDAKASSLGGRLLIAAIAGDERNLFYQFSSLNSASEFIEHCCQLSGVRAEVWNA